MRSTLSSSILLTLIVILSASLIFFINDSEFVSTISSQSIPTMLSSAFRDQFPFGMGFFDETFPFIGRSSRGSQGRLTQGSSSGDRSSSSAGQGQLTRHAGASDANVGLWDFSRYLHEPMSLGLEEHDDPYKAMIHCPADLKPNDLSIELKDGVLTIHGEHETNEESKGSKRRSYTRFSRSMILPENVDEAHIKADVDEKGEKLIIQMPKTQESHVKRITIGKGSKDNATSSSTSSTDVSTSSSSSSSSPAQSKM